MGCFIIADEILSRIFEWAKKLHGTPTIQFLF